MYHLNSSHDQPTMPNKHLGIFHPSVLEQNVHRVSRTSQPMVSLETIDERLVLRPDYAYIFASQTSTTGNNTSIPPISSEVSINGNEHGLIRFSGNGGNSKALNLKHGRKMRSSLNSVDIETQSKKMRTDQSRQVMYDPSKWKIQDFIESPEYLREYFILCPQELVDEICDRMLCCKAALSEFYSTRDENILLRVSWVNIFDIYFKGLKCILDSETRRLRLQSHPILMKNELFHLSLFLCTWIVSLFKESTKGLDLSVLLDVLKISAYDFHKILGIYVSTAWYGDQGAKILFRRIELTIILKNAWEKKTSPLLSAIDNYKSKKLWPVFPLFHTGFDKTDENTQKMTPERPLELIFSKLVAISSQRLDLLCQHLELQSPFPHLIWSIFRFILVHKCALIQGRRIDHILISAAYFVLKVVGGANTSFKTIVENYGLAISDNFPGKFVHAGFVDVEFDIDSMMRSVVCADDQSGTIVQFYNDVFIPAMNISCQNLQSILSKMLPDEVSLENLDLQSLRRKTMENSDTENFRGEVSEECIIICKLVLSSKIKPPDIIEVKDTGTGVETTAEEDDFKMKNREVDERVNMNEVVPDRPEGGFVDLSHNVEHRMTEA